MADQKQNIIQDFFKLLKEDPNVLASILPTLTSAVTAPSNSPSGSPSSSNPSAKIMTSQFKEAQSTSGDDHAEILSTNVAYSADDLLSKRPKKGKGSRAQQTFRVS